MIKSADSLFIPEITSYQTSWVSTMDCTNGYIMSDELLRIGRFPAMFQDSKTWDYEKGGLSVDDLVALVAYHISQVGWDGKGCFKGVN